MKRTAPEILQTVMPDPASPGSLPAVQRLSRMRRWMERRLWRRYVVHIPVALTSGDVQRIAIVSDISAKGVCVSGVADLSVGHAVTITMRGFEPLAGKIAWVSDDRAGVALDRSLLG